MLTSQNIEAELSYAYLHAVATKEGFSCEYSNRHMDNISVDAIIREDGRFLAENSIFASFDLFVQLKATSRIPLERDGKWSFSLPIKQYDKLRSDRITSPRILVLLILPEDPNEWLIHTEDGLIAKRCAYWVSLRGFRASDNQSTQTIYLPKTQVFSPSRLRELMTRFSRREVISYET